MLATVFFFMWLSAGLAGPSVSWDGLVTSPLGIEDPERLAELATLGCLVVAGLLVWRVIRGTKEDHD